MKTSEVFWFGAFVFCVALATLTGAPQLIVAASATAAILIGCAEDSSPRRGHMPGARKSTAVVTDMEFVHKQMQLWQWFALMVGICIVLTAGLAVHVVADEGWPGKAFRCLGIVVPRAALMVGICGILLLYGITIAVGCIQPLQEALREFSREYRCCVSAEQNSGISTGWVADTQLDWDDPQAHARRNQERNRRLFGD